MANHFSHASNPYPIRNTRFTVGLPQLAADGTPTDATTPDTEISKDLAAFVDTAEEVAQVSGGAGTAYITFSGAEMDCTIAWVQAKVASGPKTTLATIYPRNLVVIGSGTLSAGSAGGGTLGTLLAYDVTGCFIRTTGGTGGGGSGGANNQARKIMTYSISTGAFTVAPDWETTPSTDTTYDVLLPEGVTLGMLRSLNPTTSGRTLTIESDGMAHADLKEWLGTAPLALTSQRVVADVGAISGDASAADNLESYTDGTTPIPANTTQIEGSDATNQITASVPTTAQIADKILDRNIEGGADSSPSVYETLAMIRNRVELEVTSSTTGVLHIYDNAGTVELFTKNVTLASRPSIVEMEA